MNKSLIIKGIAILAGGFIVTTAVLFFLFPVIHSDLEFHAETVHMELSDPDYDLSAIGPQAVNILNGRIAELENELNLERILAQSRQTRIDSLIKENRNHVRLIAEYRKIEAVQAQIVTEHNRVEELTKSLMSLEEAELSPILKHMSDEQLAAIYRHARVAQREQLLRSLDPKRAVALINRIMS